MFSPIGSMAAALLLAALVATGSAAGVSIANSGICITDVDCPPSKYCKRTTAKVDRCVQRLPVGAVCEDHPACQDNTFCLVDVVKRCHAQGKLNERCSPVQANACRPGLTCTPPSPDSCVPAPACMGNVGRCLPSNPGRAGAACTYDRDCAQDAGFYCKGERTCAPKRPAGADCGNRSDNKECRGQCVSGLSALTGRPRKTNGVCAYAMPLGALCTEESDCARTFLPRTDRDRVVCNRPRAAELGRCALTAKLLTRLGEPCIRGKDMCDARRGLSCRWAPTLGRMGCQQRYDSVDVFDTRSFCTRGSKLSACPAANQFFPTECRVRRTLPGDPFPDFADNYTRCLRRRRAISAGSSCEIESDFCAGGSTCRVISGVRLKDPGYRPRFGPPPAIYCVRTLKKGAMCGVATKFRAQCGDGLMCSKGKCVTASGNPAAEKLTHANVAASCKELPCAPGFFCNKGNLCERPVRTTGAGKLCDDGGIVAPKCKPGLVCRTGWVPRGFKRCMGPKGVGAYCEENSWCRAGLECSQESEPGLKPGDSRCRQVLTKPLSRGQRCNPGGTLSNRRCSTVEIPDVVGTNRRQLACLRPKRGPAKCQVFADPFRLCGAANVQCGDPRFECRLNVCLPKKNM